MSGKVGEAAKDVNLGHFCKVWATPSGNTVRMPKLRVKVLPKTFDDGREK